MVRAALAILVALTLGVSRNAAAQSTAQPVLPGFLTTSGCPGGQPPCYKPYSAADPLPVDASVTATTAAVASATPTAVAPGPDAPLNIDLNSALFVQPTYDGTPVDGTHGLPVNCILGCSGGPADESAFTAGTSSIITGGFYQTTATDNALTDGQQGSVQMTAQRAFFVNLRNASGAELGVAAAPVQVSLANTGANATAVKVDGTGGAFPVSGTVAATQSGTWTVQPGNTANTTPWLATIAQGGNSATVSAGGALSANTAQVNGVTTSTGAGATGTGTQRVGVAQDTTTIAGSAPGTAGSASSNVVTVQGVASMTPVQVSQATASNLNAQVVGAAASGASVAGNPLLSGCRAATADPTAVTDGQAIAMNCGATGKVVVLPFAIKELYLSGTATATTATNTQLIAAQAGSNKIYLTGFSCYNSGNTNSTVLFTDGSGGTTLWASMNAAGGGTTGQIMPPVATTAATALYMTTGSASTTQSCSVTGYKGL